MGGFTPWKLASATTQGVFPRPIPVVKESQLLKRVYPHTVSPNSRSLASRFPSRAPVVPGFGTVASSTPPCLCPCCPSAWSVLPISLVRFRWPIPVACPFLPLPSRPRPWAGQGTSKIRQTDRRLPLWSLQPGAGPQSQLGRSDARWVWAGHRAPAALVSALCNVSEQPSLGLPPGGGLGVTLLRSQCPVWGQEQVAGGGV